LQVHNWKLSLRKGIFYGINSCSEYQNIELQGSTIKPMQVKIIFKIQTIVYMTKHLKHL